MGHTGFRSDALFPERTVFEKFQLACCAYMQDMQACSGFLGQSYSQRRRTVAGFFTADERVAGNIGILSIFLFEEFCILTDDILVFTVGSNQHPCLREDSFEGFHAVDQHVSGTCSHEEFDSAYMSLVKSGQWSALLLVAPK